MRLAMLPVACLALFLSSVDYGDASKVLSAPNVLRIGSNENIFVECQGCSGADIPVTIIVNNYPIENVQLDTKVVILTTANNFQAFGEIKIPASEFRDDPGQKHYVIVEAIFPDGSKLKKVVLATFQSGYIFIQTDKPLYTPNTRVHYRMFAVTAGMKPVEGEDDQPAIININIVTPDGIVLPEEPVSLKAGLHNGVFLLPEIVSNGTWKVVASFPSSRRQNYSTEFEVKEYVLPSFEVKIHAEKNYFFVNDEQLTVNIEARYLYGKDVDGTAFVMFGIRNSKTGDKQVLSSSIQRVLVIRGGATVKLEKAHILESYPSIDSLEGNSIYVAVSVLTESGSDLVEAEKHGIHIVKSPYRIHLKNTPHYFKPTMSFEVVVFVEYPDGSPAPDVPIVVGPGHNPGRTTSTGFARVPINPSGAPQRLDITVTTADPQSVGRQATASMTAQPYSSTHQRYMHIGVGASEVKLGDDLTITLTLNAQPVKLDLTYLIQSKGQLVKHGRVNTELTPMTVMLRIVKEMLPSFRIIAYYHDQNEVVADSIWMDVIDSCMGSLKLELSRPAASFAPRQTFRYKITGDPGATVGLVAVDKGVYALNNKHRLTQKKVWDIVERADTGCTPGGGRNNMAVFKDAGLIFYSNMTQNDNRTELKCPVQGRSKRAAIKLDAKTALLSKYTEALQRQCCLDGMAETPLSYSCERRKEYIMDGKACADAFFECCQVLTQVRAASELDDPLHGRNAQQNMDFKDSGQIESRTEFPESWLWLEYKLPLCAGGTTNCKTTTLERTTVLKDSITTWHLTGISLSPTHGICIDDTFNVIVQKDFFIDLRLPYSAVRGEQIEIKAILHNNLQDEIKVMVYLIETPDVCSSASNRREYSQKVTVAGQSTRSVPFIIIPMKHGTYPIEVKASVAVRQIDDGIQRNLIVVPNGIKKRVQVNEYLKLNSSQAQRRVVITNPINDTYIVPNSPRSSEIYVTGGSQMNVLVEKVLSGSSMGSLIRQPGGCGEQNMMSMTLPVIATIYLDKTNQWERVGFSRREEALAYIKKGYQNELAFHNADGSFTVFTGRTGLSWLTSYVAKVFAMAFHLVDIDINIICGAIRWVILNSQMPDGKFKEVGQLIHGEMTGNVHGMDSDASMTAFSLIAMQETQTLCVEKVNSIPGSIRKAVGFLEKRLPSLTNPYAVAMVSYALANENKFNKEILYRFASRDLNHWQVPSGHLYTLEATAYALLALVKAKEFEAAAPIVRWLSTQRIQSGGFISTQSTIMVYQAVGEYSIQAKEHQYQMDIEIQVPGRSAAQPFSITNENAFQTRTAKFKGINKQVNVTATGSGEATISVVSLYYASPTNINEDCDKFELNVTLSEAVDSEYVLKIEYLYKDNNKDAGMTILDIGLLTGYTADISDLNKLAKRKDRIISRYEMDKVLSDRGSLIIYLDKVSHTQREEVAFRIKRPMKVGVLQPAAVSIYEYYNEKPCLKFYHPFREEGHLLLLGQGDLRKCIEEECSLQKKGKINNNERNIKVCDADAKIDYVYKVRLETAENYKSTDIFRMRIQQVIKEGSSDKVPLQQLRKFIGYSHCRESLGLSEGKDYLIMGTFLNTEKVGDEFQYVLGEKTWIEYWPTDPECQTRLHEHTCQGLEDLVYTFQTQGCKD